MDMERKGMMVRVGMKNKVRRKGRDSRRWKGSEGKRMGIMKQKGK